MGSNMVTGLRLLYRERANRLQDLLPLNREISDMAGITNRKGLLLCRTVLQYPKNPCDSLPLSTQMARCRGGPS